MKFKIAIIGVVLSLSVSVSYGQQSDSTEKQARTYMSRRLKIDTLAAGQVVSIQEAYKTAVRKVIANGSLSDDQKRAEIISLADEKNKKLRKFLTAEQLLDIVPTTERTRGWKPDTTLNTTH